MKIFYGDPKKLSSIKNAGELACSQPNLNAAKSLCRKKFKKPKFLGLKIKMRSYLFKNAVKLRQKRAIKAQSQLHFTKSLVKFRSKNIIEKNYPLGNADT